MAETLPNMSPMKTDNQSSPTDKPSRNRLAVGVLLAAVLLGSAVLSGQQGQAAEKLASADKNSFQEVTAQLDPGGDFYFYLSTEKLLEGISGKISGLRNLFGAMPNVTSESRENINKGFDIATRVIKHSGIEDISGLGMNSVALETNLYHGKLLLHHYKGKGSGFLWTAFGKTVHPLSGLGLLPTNTVLAAFSDCDLAMVWSAIEKEAAQSGFPQAEELLRHVSDGFQMATGLQWDQVLASLGGEYGLVFTLDQTKKLTLPVPLPEPLEIPEPGLMLVLKVKDNTIFDRVDKALKDSGQQVESTDRPGLKMRTVSIPLPLPLPLRPSIARTGDCLLVATTDTLIEEALAVQAGQKPGLKSTPEFLHLAQGVPDQGNKFCFISRRLGETVGMLQSRALSAAGNADDKQRAWLHSFLTSANVSCCYDVWGNTDQGWLLVGNGNQHPAKVLLAASVAPAAIAAAVALPAIAKAKAKAQEIKAERQNKEKDKDQ